MLGSSIEERNNANYAKGYCTDMETIREQEYPLLSGMTSLMYQRWLYTHTTLDGL